MMTHTIRVILEMEKHTNAEHNKSSLASCKVLKLQLDSIIQR